MDKNRLTSLTCVCSQAGWGAAYTQTFFKYSDASLRRSNLSADMMLAPQKRLTAFAALRSSLGRKGKDWLRPVALPGSVSEKPAIYGHFFGGVTDGNDVNRRLT